MDGAWQGEALAEFQGGGRKLAAIAEFDSVGLRYGTGAEVLRDLDFRLGEGTFYFLTGPSGAGKTSLRSNPVAPRRSYYSRHRSDQLVPFRVTPRTRVTSKQTVAIPHCATFYMITTARLHGPSASRLPSARCARWLREGDVVGRHIVQQRGR